MRFLKNLFSVPKGKKVTEADMKRVLVSSVCGILLCMTCLISSTWAWYTVSMETAAFTIDVADAKLAIEVNGAQADGTSVVLTPAVETVVDVTFTPAQTPDALNVTPQRYIIMTVIDEQEQPLGTYYVACKGDVTQVKLLTDAACTVYFTPAWQIPPTGKQFPTESFKLVEATTEPTTTAPAETSVPAATTEPKPTEPRPTEPKVTEPVESMPSVTTAPADQEGDLLG